MSEQNSTKKLFFTELTAHNWDIVKALIENGADVNWKSKKGSTALEFACDKRNSETCRFLIENGANLDLLPPYSAWTLFRMALSEEDPYFFDALMRSKWKSDILSFFTKDDVVEAVCEGQSFALECYIQAGYDMKWIDFGKKNLLQYAVQNGQIDIAKRLLELGLDLFHKNVYGLSPLNDALDHGYWVFIRYAAQKLNMSFFQLEQRLKQDGENYTPFLHSAVAHGDMQIVKYLVEDLGFDVQVRDSLGQTVLFHIGRTGSIPLIQYLLDKGLDINARAKDKSTPLIRFVDDMHKVNLWHKNIPFANHCKPILIGHPEPPENWGLMHEKSKPWVEALNFLLDHGAKINLADENGVTALSQAVEDEMKEIIQLLLDRGANINPRKKPKMSMLNTCLKNGRTDLFKMLFEAGAKPNDRIQRITVMDIMYQMDMCMETMEEIFNMKDEANFFTISLNPSKEEEQEEDISEDEIRKLRQERIADAQRDEKDKKRDYYSLLHEAVLWRNLEVVKYLIEKGMDVNIRSDYQLTPLHCTAFTTPHAFYDNLIDFKTKEQIKIAQFLVQQGADVDAKDNMGLTPLMTAIEFKEWDLIEPLLKLGADKSIKNLDGKTALEIARENKITKKYIDILRGKR